MKDSYSIEIRKAKNGYIVEECWYYKESEFTQHKSEKTICTDWEDVGNFVNSCKDNF